MTPSEIVSLFDAASTEAKDILDRVADNGYVGLKPGSPALAVLYAYDEAFRELFNLLHKMRNDVLTAIQ